jgi:dTDP-4-amino-4,6-dideoxygalactose transaminase
MRTCEAVVPAPCSDQQTGLGAVAALEARLTAHYGMRYAVAMPSATTGLLALGLALDLRGADFVAPPLTYGGSISSWLALGASVRFADIEHDSLTLAPQAACRALTPACRAILGVDLFGVPCDDEGLRAIADRRGLWLVVDGAQSFGARIDGRAAGTLADALVVSFTSGKALDGGEGGAVLTNHRHLYERLIWHSQHPYRQKRELGLHCVNELGINGRIHPLAARRAYRRFDTALTRVAHHRVFVEQVLGALATLPEVKIPGGRGGVEPSYHRLTVRRTRPDAAVTLERHLACIGVSSSVAPIPASLLYRHAPLLARDASAWARTCPVAERESAVRICVRLAGCGTPDAAERPGSVAPGRVARALACQAE